jgi:hypothetical protein
MNDGSMQAQVVCHYASRAEGEKSSKIQKLLWIARSAPQCLIAAVCSLRPSLYAKVLNSRAFFALQITTPRGRLQQTNQFDCVIPPIPDADI